MGQTRTQATILLILMFATMVLDAQTLKVTEGWLVLRNGGTELLVKRLEASQCFRGYDIVDSEHVFVAYQGLKYGDATTRLGVVDVRTAKETIVCDDIGGSGFSYFEYNPRNDFVMFDLEDGLYAVRIHDPLGHIITSRSRKPERVFSFAVRAPHVWFWNDSTSFGINWTDSGKVELHSFRPTRDH